MIASSNWTYDGSAPRNWPLPPDSDVANSLAYLLRFLPVEDLRVLLGQPPRDVPADDADVAVLAEVHRAAVTGALEELLLQVGVAPVLDDDVDLAGAEALPGDVLLEVLVVDGAAESSSATSPTT